MRGASSTSTTSTRSTSAPTGRCRSRWTGRTSATWIAPRSRPSRKRQRFSSRRLIRDVAAPPKDPGSDPLRAGGAVLAVLALLAVVALAAAAGGPATSGDRTDLADPLATLLFVLGAVWVAALLVASPILSGLTLTGGEPKPRRWHGNVLAGAV